VTLRVKKVKGCVLCGNIIFTEINYHHKVLKVGVNLTDRTPNGAFIELKNIGNTPLVLTAAKIISKSIKYTFPVAVLDPNKFWVISLYREDFKLVYGNYPNDTFTGQPAYDSGDHSLKLVDSVGNLVQDFTYSTELPWPKLSDGNGFTLVANVADYMNIAMKTDTTAHHFRASAKQNGSPWQDEPTPAPANMGLIWYFVSFEEKWIEFYNPTNRDIDLSLWAIKRNFNSNDKGFVFPTGTKIAPGTTIRAIGKDLVFDRDHTVVLFKTILIDNKYVYTGEHMDFDDNSNEFALAVGQK